MGTRTFSPQEPESVLNWTAGREWTWFAASRGVPAAVSRVVAVAREVFPLPHRTLVVDADARRRIVPADQPGLDGQRGALGSRNLGRQEHG